MSRQENIFVEDVVEMQEFNTEMERKLCLAWETLGTREKEKKKRDSKHKQPNIIAHIFALGSHLKGAFTMARTEFCPLWCKEMALPLHQPGAVLINHLHLASAQWSTLGEVLDSPLDVPCHYVVSADTFWMSQCSGKEQ